MGEDAMRRIGASRRTAGQTLLLTVIAGAGGAAAQVEQAPPTPDCPSCAEWNAPHAPLHIYGNSWYVGTDGLAAILLTSDEGHVLIDGGLAESAAPIAASIRALGFRIEDVALIVNSHVHYDHAGGIAALQRASGASVAASPSSAAVLERGASGPDDPQFGILPPIDPVRSVRVIADGEVLRVGPITLTAHFTPGHTPGGTSWSWRSCENDRCLEFVYADSQTPVSADDFHYSRSPRYPRAVQDFERSFATLERLPCDVLITPHPGASGFWERVAAKERGEAGALGDGHGCRRYAATAREALARRLEREAAGR
jgi:metallo-beta-lactamase class B